MDTKVFRPGILVKWKTSAQYKINLKYRYETYQSHQQEED